jgi:hypothetical protein
VSFFDDDDEVTVPEPRPRRRSSRSRTRLQRFAVLAVILFVVVLVLALSIRSCQGNRKKNAYSSYMAGVQTVVDDSAAVTKQIGAILADPTKYSRKQLLAKLDGLETTQREILTRTQQLDPPRPLAEEQTALVQGMQVRLEGVRLFHDGIVKALGVKNTAASAANIASYSGYFTGPDVYYQMFFYAPAQVTVQKEVGGGVTVPAIDPAKSAALLDATLIKSAIDRMQASRKLTGIHGVSLVSVVLNDQNGKQVAKLVPNREVRVTAGPGLVFRVSVQNQGTITETNVPLTVTVVPPGTSAEQKLAQTMASIPAGATQTADVPGFNPAASSIGRVTIVKVFVGPVPEEQTTSNNKAEYKLRLTYPSG